MGMWVIKYGREEQNNWANIHRHMANIDRNIKKKIAEWLLCLCCIQSSQAYLYFSSLLFITIISTTQALSLTPPSSSSVRCSFPSSAADLSCPLSSEAREAEGCHLRGRSMETAHDAPAAVT